MDASAASEPEDSSVLVELVAQALGEAARLLLRVGSEWAISFVASGR
jgi:hypothetical protein